MGLIVTMPLTGFMTNLIGWASPFYLIGSVTCVWFGFWVYLVHNSPEEHPRISEVSSAFGFFIILTISIFSNRKS